MITEDYVSLETAKLLKEKGFDEEVRTFYSYDSEIKTWEFEEDDRWDTPNSWGYGEYYLSAPTLQMAMKWLREVHKCFIEIKEYFDIKQYQAFVSKYGKTTYCEPDWFHPICNSYEEACEAAIKYCLENLI